VQYDHIFFGPRKKGVINSIRIFDRLPFRFVLEPLSLHSGYVKNVSIRQDFLERFQLLHKYPGLPRNSDHLCRHRKRWRRDEVQAD
jgi:hypothetical protein